MGPRSGLRVRNAALLFCVVLGWPLASRGFTPTVTGNGTPVKWRNQFKLNLAGNPENRRGFEAESFRTAVIRGLRRWQGAAGGSVRFDYWQGTDQRVFPANSAYDGTSSIYFSSNGAVSNSLTANVLGLTQVWYDTGSGEILEADIALNDRDFDFTTDARDTSGYGAGLTRFTGAHSKVFIENVITHELGHALGLSHSGGLQSTMLFMESPEQAHLACDEAVGIHALYPSGDAGDRGTLAGSVVSESGAPVFGAHVVLISRRRGAVMATGITDRGGGFAISALEPGIYFLLVEPFYAGPQTLPAFYSSVRSDVCRGGRSFSRTLLMESTGIGLEPIRVDSGRVVTLPALRVSCADRVGAPPIGARARIANGADGGMADAIPIFDGLAGETGFGSVDRIRSKVPAHYLLKSVSGNIEVHALSYSLYSPVHPEISLVDGAGSLVPAVRVHQVYFGDSGYVNYDSALTAKGLAPGDYYLRVTGKPLDSMLYPAGPISLDPVPFFLLTGTLNEDVPPLSPSLPFNARCRMDERFAAYTSPPGNPPRTALEKPESNGGFCGTIRSETPPDGPGPGAAAIAGWFLPWLAMLASARLARYCLVLPKSEGTVNLNG